MARLRNPKSGSVVNVSDDTAARLAGYEPVASEAKPAAKKSTAKKASSRKSSK